VRSSLYPQLRRTAFVAVALAGSLSLALAGSSSALAANRSAARPGRVTVPNAQPKLTRAHLRGASPGSERIDVRLYLADQNAAELDSAVQAVSTPGSADYGKYLTGEQFRARYAPSEATVASVRSFVEAAGLAVTGVAGNRSYLSASGTVATVQEAFGTSLKQYDLQGRTIRAAATAPTIPDSLQGQVIALSGLSSVSSLVTPNHEDGPTVTKRAAARRSVSGGAPPPDAFVNAKPCSTYFGEKAATATPKAYGKTQPYAPCGYTPVQLQGAYGLKTALAQGNDGRGVTVAITDAYAAPTILTDSNTYAGKHGQKAFAKGQFTQVTPGQPYRYGYDDTVNGDQCGEQGWYGEETLDVEAVHAVAPGAKVTYVAARSCDNADFADALNTVVDRHLADIVTNSWGGTDESNGSPELDRVYEQIFHQAALEGIGFYFSSGDSGDGSSAGDPTADPPIPPNGPTAQAPANSPFVTAVGGTSLAVGKGDNRIFETGWSTAKSTLTDGAWTPAPPGAYVYGAGGGTSRVFAQPWYQRGVVPDALARRYSSEKARVVPDVSAIGDPNTGFLVGETQTFPDGSATYSEYRIGGTSLASPVFAGIMALADQKAGHPHGFANPALYGLYGSGGLYDPKPLTGVGVVRVDYVNSVDATEGTTTSLRTLDTTVGTILRARTGYDDITGIGSPSGSAFLSALAR
jgi:subtilase family serine protease